MRDPTKPPGRVANGRPASLAASPARERGCVQCSVGAGPFPMGRGRAVRNLLENPR
jgi:hypothetical protein